MGVADCLDFSVAGALRGGIRRPRTTAPRSPYRTIALVGGRLRRPSLCARPLQMDSGATLASLTDVSLAGTLRCVLCRRAPRGTKVTIRHRRWSLSCRLPFLLRSRRCWCRGWPRSVRTHRSPFLPARTSCLPAHAPLHANSLHPAAHGAARVQTPPIDDRRRRTRRASLGNGRGWGVRVLRHQFYGKGRRIGRPAPLGLG